MRRLLLLIPLVLLTGCPSQPDMTDDSPWVTVTLKSGPLDVPYQAVTVAEVARRTPPDGITWPASMGLERQTAWVWRDGSPVLMAAEGGEWLGSSEDGPRGPATAYVWDWDTGSAETHLFDPQPPNTVNEPIPCPGDDDSPVKYALVGAGGESSTQAFRIGEGEPVSAPIVDGIMIYNSDGSLDNSIEIDTDTHEFDPYDVLPSLEGSLLGSLVLMETRIEWVPMPNSATKIPVARWARIDLNSGAVERLDRMSDLVAGVWLDGYLDGPGWFFLSGPEELALVDSLRNGTIALEPYQRPDRPEEPPTRLGFTGGLPSVHWGNSHIVFCRLSSEEDEDKTHIVALQFHGDSLSESEPSIIWESDVPNIFLKSIAVPTGPDRRPYIVCLDALTGELTVFDPLLGSIRHQSTIELALPSLLGGLAAFCVNFEPDPSRPTVLIHDPNANEFVQIELVVREAGEGGGIVPVE